MLDTLSIVNEIPCSVTNLYMNDIPIVKSILYTVTDLNKNYINIVNSIDLNRKGIFFVKSI